MSRFPLALTLTLCALCPTAPAQADQIVLKQGVNNYYGTTDTWIDYYNENTNYGSSDYMYVYINNDVPRKSGSVNFDLTGMLPPNAVIQSATLSMCLWGLEDMGSGDYVDVGVYRIRQYRDWVESQATWYVFKGTTYWSTAGCENTSWDRYGTYDSSRYFDDNTPTGYYYDWDVTSSVQSWYGGAENNGWLVRVWRHDSVAGEGIILGTKDATLGVRPRLTVNYTVIPEPGTLMALAMGVAGLIATCRRPRRP